MIRALSLLIAIAILSCSSQKQGDGITQQKIETSSKCPEIIDSMGLQGKYDIAKWNLYCIYCDDSVKFRNKTFSDRLITFGSLDLRFKEAEKKGDSIELHFEFYLDSVKCDFEVIDDFGTKFFTNGVLFIRDSLVFYTTPTTLKYFWQEGNRNRFFKPLQPEVIQFIKNNKNKLDPWFREEAKRRKIIE